MLNPLLHPQEKRGGVPRAGGRAPRIISGLVMGHGIKDSAPSSHGPPAYPVAWVPPARTWVSALMAFPGTMGNLTAFPGMMGNLTTVPEWTGSRWLQGASAAAGKARGRQWEMSYSVPHYDGLCREAAGQESTEGARSLLLLLPVVGQARPGSFCRLRAAASWTGTGPGFSALL